MRVSECCGSSPVSNGDCDTEDFGICPACGEHCEYVEADEDGIPFERYNWGGGPVVEYIRENWDKL